MNDSKLNICFKGIHSWGRHVSLIWNSNGNDLLCFQKTWQRKVWTCNLTLNWHHRLFAGKRYTKGLYIQWLNYVNMVLINVYIARWQITYIWTAWNNSRIYVVLTKYAVLQSSSPIIALTAMCHCERRVFLPTPLEPDR